MKDHKKLFFESLGCPKNRVDSEVIIANFLNKGWVVTDLPQDADLIILNTCSFIHDARVESVNRFFELHSVLKKGAKVAVAGCMPQLYPDLKAMLPEADFIFGINDIAQIFELVEKNIKKGYSSVVGNAEFIYNSGMERVLTYSPYTAYVKIADGCENFCAYCSIPFIRGKYRERSVADIVREVENLVSNGVKEIVLISQDTTKFGSSKNSSLSKLLTEINSIIGEFKIRVMYLYPGKVDITLLETIKKLKKVVNYLEIPVQHVSDTVLKEMNRPYGEKDLISLIKNIKEVFGTDYTLRTTFISSFPSEKKKDHEMLKSFIEKGYFDYSGVFKYSKEEFTKAGKMRSVSATEAEKRFLEIEKTSHIAMEKRLDRFVGLVMEILYEGIDPELQVPVGRGWHQAPEIDGLTILTNVEDQKPGKYYKCKIVSREGVDFIAEIL